MEEDAKSSFHKWLLNHFGLSDGKLVSVCLKCQLNDKDFSKTITSIFFLRQITNVVKKHLQHYEKKKTKNMST